MPCAVALSNSPVFSPSHRVTPIFCKPAVNLSMHNSTPSSPYSSSSLSSPLSPLGFRFQKNCKKESPIFKSSSAQSSLLLKRKRPLRIEIPVASLGLAPEDRLNEVEEVEVEMEVEGEGYSVYCKRGKRVRLEDRYSAVVGLEGDSKQVCFFGVFDGHGGAKAAEFAAKNMVRNIMDELTKRCEEGIEEAVKEGYRTTDAEFLKEGVSGGTCCATVLIHKGRLVVSNAGDCRAVMSRGGVAEALTIDHRPSRKDEKERIESMGGYVDFCHGVWRIQGSLAVSRGIGDGHLKKWVISEPETRILNIRPDCEFLILASDGLWDKVSNQEAVDVVRPLCVGSDKTETFSACRKLAELSATRGSTDDISVMVIPLPHFSP